MISDCAFYVVCERLKQVLNLSSDRALAAELGMKPAAFYNRKKSESLPLEEIIDTCLSRNVSLDWLFTNEGQPLRSGPQPDLPTVAAVEPRLLGLVMAELERARAFEEKADSAVAKERAVKAAKMGFLAARVYNKAMFVKNAKLQLAAIREDAEGYAYVARVFSSDDVSLDEQEGKSD
ncbi:hypothetical protein GPA22_21445 [Aromatoleum toluvorans]|uniref:Bacteriophage CI repressor N-terminal domain-containing protein n=1 Tax=Aromatoleum toluvorans TaxID=92002 RepID=A0ABX1Q3J0_9RHOO|nr:helix-turn-helix domain-containing protein [Aromatoleum toluvorans]NMG46289.1 hypothetical protein [Aromatoleum toluvorans]